MISLRNAAFLVLVLLVGCAGLAPKPKTLDQQLAYAEGQVTAGYTAVADLATRKRITAAQGTKFIEDLDVISTALKTARIAVGQGNLTQAKDYLKTAEKLLLEFEKVKQEVK